ncbi:MAG: hypothetical protein K0V04_44125 [Deltaproteobacteria bacterium]|nr:hypothetical protein [Deltaproteobacteria bacterium]
MEPSSSPLEIVYEDPRLQMATHRNVSIAVWHDAPQIDQMRAFVAHFEAEQRRHPEGIAALSIVLGGTPVFSSEVRAAVNDLNRAGLVQHGIAHVILVGGLVGATVRAFLSTALLLGRGQQPAKVFDSVRTGSAWLVETMAAQDIAWDVDALTTLAQGFASREPVVAG